MNRAALVALGGLAVGALGSVVAVFFVLQILQGHGDGAEVRDRSALPAAQSVLVYGATPAQGAQALLEHVRQSARTSGVAITSVEVRPGQDDQDRHAVLISAEAAYDDHLRFLHRMESGPPAVLVTQAQLSTAPGNGNRMTLEVSFEAWSTTQRATNGGDQ